MVYLAHFYLLDHAAEDDLSEGFVFERNYCSDYPLNIFPKKNLDVIDFDPITIVYGSNGSGKSTLLNIIAQKLKLPRETKHNQDYFFDEYVDHCNFKMGESDDGCEYHIPNKSKVITSDDIFNHILESRNKNIALRSSRDELVTKAGIAKMRPTAYNPRLLQSLDDFPDYKEHWDLKKKKITGLLAQRVGDIDREFSNGEVALRYFADQIAPDNIYLLDEPENSLSPKFQLKLVSLLEEAAYRCACQFIIATHSPFILSLHGAKIYDIDEAYVRTKEWYELENMRIYYELFQKNQFYFEKSQP